MPDAVVFLDQRGRAISSGDINFNPVYEYFGRQCVQTKWAEDDAIFKQIYPSRLWRVRDVGAQSWLTLAHVYHTLCDKDALSVVLLRLGQVLAG